MSLYEYKPKFIMLVGLPASGKSTFARELKEQFNYEIFSSDEIRQELYGDIEDQKHNQKVFQTLHKRIKDCLRLGKSCVYDATNISYKRRKGFLQELSNISCEKICYLIAAPYEICLERNELRERQVPEEVIERMYYNFNIPYWYEGWNEIHIIWNNSLYNSSIYNSFYEYDLAKIWNFNQDNSHHTLTLGQHCKKAEDWIFNKMVNDLVSSKYRETMCYAAKFHDLGKIKTKVFYNSRGEMTDEAHYYYHQNVGAYDSLFYHKNYSVDDLDVAIRIMWHMQPYFCGMEKYRKLWGEELYNDIMLLHEADKAAH